MTASDDCIEAKRCTAAEKGEERKEKIVLREWRIVAVVWRAVLQRLIADEVHLFRIWFPVELLVTHVVLVELVNRK
jgi:hypothetical protein